MSDVRESLRRRDPLAHESWPDDAAKARVRARVSSAGTAPISGPTPLRGRPILVGLFAAAMLLATLWRADIVPSLTTPAFAAVRFEVRLAEEHPRRSPREASVGTTQQVVYLHEDVVVSNGDVTSAAVVPSGGGDRFEVEVRLSGLAAERMRVARGAISAGPSRS